jgi:hypothetical protein
MRFASIVPGGVFAVGVDPEERSRRQLPSASCHLLNAGTSFPTFQSYTFVFQIFAPFW